MKRALPHGWPGAVLAERRLSDLATLLEEQVGQALGPNEGDRVWERHVVDSLLPVEVVASWRRVADVGSGAGLPGLPLALACPWVAVTLVEPRKLRAAWLRTVVDRLAVTNTEVIESLWARTPARRYDGVVARALAVPEEAVRLLAKGPVAPRVLLYVAAGTDIAGARRIASMVDTGRVVLDIDTA